MPISPLNLPVGHWATPSAENQMLGFQGGLQAANFVVRLQEMKRNEEMAKAQLANESIRLQHDIDLQPYRVAQAQHLANAAKLNDEITTKQAATIPEWAEFKSATMSSTYDNNSRRQALASWIKTRPWMSRSPDVLDYEKELNDADKMADRLELQNTINQSREDVAKIRAQSAMELVRQKASQGLMGEPQVVDYGGRSYLWTGKSLHEVKPSPELLAEVKMAEIEFTKEAGKTFPDEEKLEAARQNYRTVISKLSSAAGNRGGSSIRKIGDSTASPTEPSPAATKATKPAFSIPAGTVITREPD